MRKNYTRIVPLLLLLLLTNLSGRADCTLPGAKELTFEDFESGMPQGWKAVTGSDGGTWQVNALPFGFYENPGEENWIYVNDEEKNQIGTAELVSPIWNLIQFPAFVEVSFDLNFQEYANKGAFSLLVFDGQEWQEVYQTREDIIARISIDLSDYVHETFQLRFVYADEGSWGWGMGIDNFRLVGLEDQCGNGTCDFGETPSNCKDCERFEIHSGAWLKKGIDLTEKEVVYQSFLNGQKCDDCAEKIDLGFEIDFLGKKYQTIFLNANGNLTFEEPFISFTPEPFCLEGPQMIAPFFADVDLTQGGEITYYADPKGHYWIGRWENVAYFGTQAGGKQTNSFQVILTDGSIRSIGEYIIPLGANVLFGYGDMQWTTGTSSGGAQGFSGAPATVGLNHGDGENCYDYGLFDRDGFAYYGNHQDDLCMANGVSHLDHRTIAFSSSNGKREQAKGNIVLKGIKKETGISLLWCTDRLAETQFFLLERVKGPDRSLFEEITMINPLDSDAKRLGEYTFLDTEAEPDSNFYRVTSVKEDGSLSFSPIIAVAYQPSGNPRGTSSLALSMLGPNPFRDYLQVEVNTLSLDPIHYRIVDMKGIPVVEGVWEGGKQRKEISLPNLARAMYIFTIRQGDEVLYRNLVRE